VVFSNGGVGWTEIGQPNLILNSILNNTNTWPLAQAFNGGITGTTAAFSGGITGTTAAFSGGITGTTAAFSGSAASDSMIIGSGRSSSVQASLAVKGQLRAPQYIIGNPISGSSITYGAVTANNLLPPPMFQGGTGALTSVGTAATGTSPLGVAVDPTGRFVFVTNFSGATVQAYTVNQSTGALTAVGSAIAAGTNPYGIAVDPTGRFVFVANQSDATVQAYTVNQSTGALTFVGVVATAAGSFPRGVAVDPTGRFVFVGNGGGNTVQAYRINNFAANSGTFQDQLTIGTTALVPSASAVSLTLPSSAGTLALTSQITAPSTLLSSANSWTNTNTFTSNIINNAPNGTISSTITNVLGGNFGLSKLLVKNNILYAFAFSYQTPCIYDVTDPASPLLLLSAGSGERVYTYSAEAVEIQGDVLYANHNRGSGVVIATYDISNPSQFTFLNSITTQPAGDAVAPSAGFLQMKVVGQYLYAFKTNTGYLHTYDISNPSAITLVSLVNTGITGTNFSIPVGHSGKFLYFSFSGTNLMSVSIENPELPAVVQNYAPGYSYMFGCAIHPNGRYLYQQTSNSSGTPNRILVHDIKNTASITTVAAVATGGSLTAGGTMFIAGQMMWVQTSDGISTQFSINNPASPASTGVTYATYGIQQIVGQTFYSFTGASTTSSVQIRTSQGIFGSQVDFGSMSAHQVLIGNSGLEVLGSTDIKGGLTIRRSSRFGSNISVNGKITATSTNVSGTATMASANISGTATMSSATITGSATIIGSATMSNGTVSGTLTGNKITQPNLPFVVNDISRYFDGNTASFPLRKDQSALTSLVTSSGAISSIVSSATQFVVTHLLGTIVPGSSITISGCSTAGYNKSWLVSASTSTTCTVMTPVNLASAPATPGTLAGSLTSIVDSKDVEVILNGQYLDPYVTELRYPWISEWDANGGFKVSGSNLILYNAPVSGDKATVKVTGISQSVQTRRYPFSSATIALGE